MATATTQAPERTSVRVHVQKFGTFLSNMIMPNISAIIAWGLVTAFFIDVGWTPNEKIATMVGPALYYVLPVLIAYTGGKMVYGVRGGVVGGFAVIGVIMATSDPIFLGDDRTGSPMFLGAMIMGPLTAWLMKHVDALWAGKIKPGFEMLVDNFSAGILGGILAVVGMFVLAPPLLWVIDRLGEAVDWLVSNDVLPLTSLFIEPAKVLFLNNAINHGVLTPLGIEQAQETGKSVLFLLEANPAAGFGLLMAYTVFGKGMAKATAPGAAIIQFLGGIHEVYFPYVLMKPRLIVAMIAGGMTQIFINVTFDSGLRAPAAPGSIFAVYAQTPRDSLVGVTLSVIGGAAVSFVIAAVLLRMDKGDIEETDLLEAMGAMESLKGKKSAAAAAVIGAGAAAPSGPIKNVVFACDAGMGSSAMGASVLRKKIHDAGYKDVTVVNKSIADLTDSYDVVVTHQDLAARAGQKTGSAVLVTVDNFMGSPRYDEIVELVRESNTQAPAREAAAVAEPATAPLGELLPEASIVLEGTALTREEAITEAGRLLVASGAVEPAYVTAMHEREKSVSTFMGNGLALPHGTNEAKSLVRATGISFVRYSDGVDWKGKEARFVVGVASAGDDHLTLLGKIAEVFLDPARIAALESATTKAQVLAVLNGVKVG
ncbi:MAG TPA: PTS mannitol transporter subunit IICBA [Nocardioides sp.]|uniref:PTS mannitol transporter subunit IICBA n=1 Tax=Nocardioides sp. TaxID=35761 RepID=UPI002B981DF6|nr:PTS mannitol transporter subunit IICBA [Nocardioides sp.]HQR27344.1 PTS mannitol transporter subunit IICBA [Nocardioides sp.]